MEEEKRREEKRREEKRSQSVVINKPNFRVQCLELLSVFGNYGFESRTL
jgi:hypothetical protein